MQKIVEVGTKNVILDYKEPYKILPVRYTEDIVVFKDNYPLFRIESADFVIQVDDDEFIFTRDLKSKQTKRDVEFMHLALLPKPHILYYQNRLFGPFNNFPLKRLGRRFVLPPYFSGGSDIIYDAENRKCMESLLGCDDILKVEIEKGKSGDYFKINDCIFVGNNLFGKSEYLNFITVWRQDEDYPRALYNVCDKKIYSLGNEQKDKLIKYIGEYKIKREHEMAQELQKQNQALEILLKGENAIGNISYKL